MNESYQIDFLIVSHDAERWNFSESTNLSEALMVATKTNNAKTPDGHQTIVVNLWHNPRTAFEAMAIARDAMREGVPNFLKGAKRIEIGGETWGEIVSVDEAVIKKDWFLPCAFAQSDLTRTAYRLAQGNLSLPTVSHQNEIPMCALGDLGKLGYDIRDIHDAFEISNSFTSFPAFWGHDSKNLI